jgi:hypothetical protein
MSPEEIKKKIAEDPDFIAIKRFGNSMKQLLERYPDGCPDKVIAQALLIEETEVEDLYQKTVRALRISMKVR